jgi:hypothetical protein
VKTLEFAISCEAGSQLKEVLRFSYGHEPANYRNYDADRLRV